MNAMTDATVTEVQQIEASLDTLLAAIILHDQRPRTEPLEFKSYSLADLSREFEEDQARTEEGRFAHRLRDDPVRAALCYAVRRLGKRLYEVGGLEAMTDACDRVAEMDEAHWGKRTSIMDHRWNGIGFTATTVGWCS